MCLHSDKNGEAFTPHTHHIVWTGNQCTISSLIGIFVEHPLLRATGYVFVKPGLMHTQGYTGMKRLRPWVAIGLLHHFIILGAHGSLYVEKKESSF